MDTKEIRGSLASLRRIERAYVRGKVTREQYMAEKAEWEAKRDAYINECWARKLYGEAA